MYSKRNWFGLFLIGAINNLPYVIVNSAASSIANSFDVGNFVGLIFGANVSLSIFVKSLNTFALLKVPYKIRFLVNGCLMLLGLFGVAYAFSFGFAIACIVIVGSSAAFGENVTLGYLHKFPSELVNAWSSGTGMAGLLGSSLFIIFGCTLGNGAGNAQQLRHVNKMAFLLTTPIVLLYWFAYFVIIREPGQQTELFAPFSTQNVQHAHVEDSEDDPLLPGHIPDAERRISFGGTEETKFRRHLRCLILVLWLSLNLAAVYLFEYVARACAAKVRPHSEYNHGCPELYAALQLCYQAGVFVSRSSVQLVQIRRVHILSILQLINMLVWIMNVHYKFIPLYLLPALMVYVGLLGGASYVNIFYRLLHDEKYPKADRELCVNLAALFVTIGIACGTGVETALFTTVLKND